jgi:hypothetical protein
MPAFGEQADYRNRFRPPDELYLGTAEGTWPVQAFTSEAHVISWLSEKGDHRRHAWKVHLDEVTEMVLTPPVAAKLTEKELRSGLGPLDALVIGGDPAVVVADLGRLARHPGQEPGDRPCYHDQQEHAPVPQHNPCPPPHDTARAYTITLLR